MDSRMEVKGGVKSWKNGDGKNYNFKKNTLLGKEWWVGNDALEIINTHFLLLIIENHAI